MGQKKDEAASWCHSTTLGQPQVEETPLRVDLLEVEPGTFSTCLLHFWIPLPSRRCFLGPTPSEPTSWCTFTHPRPTLDEARRCSVVQPHLRCALLTVLIHSKVPCPPLGFDPVRAARRCFLIHLLQAPGLPPSTEQRFADGATGDVS